jgi:cytoskeletal protein RodZ
VVAAIKFTKKTLPQKEGLGEKLAKKRISLGLDLKDVERNIKIRAKYIEAIENSKYDVLPPEVFVKGFVRSYAEFLKLDPNKVMKIYERERRLVENVRKAKSTPPIVKPLDTPRFVITPKTISLGGLAILALGIVLYISWQVNILTAAPKIQLTSPGDNINIEANDVVIEGKTDLSATVLINDVEIGTDQEGKFKEKINLGEGVNIIKIKAQNKMGRFTEITRTIVSKQNSISNNGNLAGVELRITIGPKSSSVQMEVDGKLVTEKPIVMLAGVSQTYKANEKIKIIASDGGSVSATFEGKEIGKIGKDNELVTREFIKGMTIN